MKIFISSFLLCALAPRGFKKETIKKIFEEECLDESDDEDFRPVISVRKSRKPKFSIRNNYKSKMENWENAEVRK